MSRMIFRGLGALGASLLLMPVVQAASFDDESENKPWAEVAFEFPPFPEQTNLIEFKVGGRQNVKFLIDGASISIGSDGVVRYTLVVVSSQGAQNISYEGMRCSTSERRPYAFGRVAEKMWSKARGDQWVAVRNGTNNHYVELYNNYLCAKGEFVSNAEAIRLMFLKGGARSW